MSLAAALNTSVAGLQAQATGLGIVSDNIANSSTVGYKATSAQFSSLVTAPPTANSYTPGGVLPKPFTHVNLQGSLQSSTSQTDIGINGNGFFPVTNAISTVTGQATGTVAFTRAGSFIVDKSGYLVNSAGQYVMGFDYGSNASPGSMATAKAIGVGNVTGNAKGTTNLALSATLNSVPSTNTPIALYGSATAANIGAGTALRAILYSSSGKAYLANLTLGPVAGGSIPVFMKDVTPLDGGPDVTAIVAPASPVTTKTGNTTAYAGNGLQISTLTSAGGVFSANGGAGVSFSDGSTLTPTIDASNLKNSGTQAIGMSVDEETVSGTIYDSLGVALNITLGFSRDQATAGTAAAPTLNSNAQRNWSMFIKSVTIATNNAQAISSIANGSNPVLPSTGFPVNMDGSNFKAGTVAAPQLAATVGSAVTFDGEGRLSGSPPTTFPAMSLTTGSKPVGGNDFTLNLGTVGAKTGLSTFQTPSDSKSNGGLQLSSFTADGVAFGKRTGISIDKDGIVSAVFSNGQTSALYRIPLATFANPNALTPFSGNLYSASEGSGNAVLNYPGQGTAGTLSPGTLESSTVDLATEFTNMIVIQRNYSANTKSITAADGMMQDLLNVIR